MSASDTTAAAAGNSDQDELVSQFMSFTGSADPARAQSYLEMSSGDLETAVGLYMEHEQSVTSMGGAGGGNSAGGVAGAGAGNSAGEEQEIRAPDATQTMRLMDDGMGGGAPMMHMNPEYQLMRDMMEEQLAQSAFSAPVGLDARAAVNAAAAERGLHAGDEEDEDDEFRYDEEKDDMEEDGDDEVQVMAGAPQPPRLSDMFAAPSHLIHKAGGFQGARTVAKDSKRWLLVNIQKDSEFASHALNRDVWRDELVENLIREGFIFWQQMDTSAEGQTYIQRYQVQDYPHIGFIDPRTGRLMWRKEGWTQESPMSTEIFAEVAMDFCSRNSFDRPPQAPRPSSSSRPAKRERPMHEMSEDEQLQAAMRASMGDLPVESTAHDDSTDDVEFLGTGDDDDHKPAAKVVAPPAAAAAVEKLVKEPSLNDELVQMNIADEPAKGARLQFKTPDGKRVVRRFDPSDAVKTIYAFVAQSNEEARGGREFVLMAGFPPKDLITDIDSTIAGCSLSGEAIAIRWKE